MDVDRSSFRAHLLTILTAISESHFVALDLELSGVSSRAPNRSREKQTLEERYQEVKEAAERYTVLQVGITCVEQNYYEDKYMLRPFNINISPLLEENLDIERIFSFQSGAVDFLLGHGFNFQLPLQNGVQYLSRDDAKLAKQLAYDRLDRKFEVEDLQLSEEDVEAIAFVGRVRAAIIAWKNAPEEYSYLNVGSTQFGHKENEDFEMSRFEKRLVHQLVRAEFSGLKTITRRGYIRIIVEDPIREAEILRDRKKEAKEKIIKQTEFRWIVEALTQGDLSPIDPRYFSWNRRNGFGKYVDMVAVKQEFYRASGNLKRKQPVLVGHNMFTDLVYFYQTFIGALPDTVGAFAEAIHELFPVIVDTKYMATHNCGDINPASSLQDIATMLDSQKSPVMEIHPMHEKYKDVEAFHEAGYDSLLTAKIMVCLSAKLDAEGTHTKDPILALSNSLQTQTIQDEEEVSSVTMPGSFPIIDSGLEANVVSTSTPDLNKNGHAPVIAIKAKKKKKKTTGGKAKPNPTRFAHTTLFDSLRTTEDGEVSSASHSDNNVNDNWGDSYAPAAESADEPEWAKVPAEGVWVEPKEPEPEKKPKMAVMPQFEEEFWGIYGNKLRVFGTREGLLRLGG